MGYKIREAEVKKTPYNGHVGERKSLQKRFPCAGMVAAISGLFLVSQFVGQLTTETNLKNQVPI